VNNPFRARLILLAGIGLLGAAFVANAVLLEAQMWTGILAVAGAALAAHGLYALRGELSGLFQRRRGEIALYAAGVIGVLIAVAYLSVRFPMRVDMTEAGLHSLSKPMVTMLQRLDKPVHIVFFHDPMMRETVELYQLIDRQSEMVTVEFFDPMLNPAQARLRGVQFAGTALMESEGRSFQVHGPNEADIANGILRVSQGIMQRVCFLDGHGEADPFSIEAHDHLEGTADHTHGLGAQYVLHERHGMAKARNALETLNYEVVKLLLLQGVPDALDDCALLVTAGPKTELLPVEVDAIRRFLAAGGNAFFMLEPFVKTGLEPLLREYGVVLDNTIVIDEASHFWADPSSPAVTSYNRHQITRDLPMSFFPGVRSLSPTPQRVPGIAVVPLVNSSARSFGETNPARAEFNESIDVRGPLTLMVAVNRRPATAAADVALALREGEKTDDDASREQLAAQQAAKGRSRIVVVGDSDFATNSFYHILGNGQLFLNAINYLAAQENLIGIEPRTYDLPRVNLTNRQMRGTFFLSVILIPSLLAAVGTAVWWKQR
jgi:ABC-type uncharacterized transport system involved in gliding motility auxiliary subunit